MKTREEMRLLNKLHELGGRVKFTHSSKFNGRQQTVALIKLGEKYYQGTACLSDKDIFDRKKGRVIALGRAFKMFEADGVEDKHGNIRNTSIVPQEQWKFKEDRNA